MSEANQLQKAIDLGVGGNQAAITHVTTDATLTADQVYVTCANTASTDYTITLPRLSEAKGRIYTIRQTSDLGTGVITITSAGDDAFRKFYHKFQATTGNTNVVRLIADAYGWDILCGNRIVTETMSTTTSTQPAGAYGENVWNTTDSLLYTCSVASTTPTGNATWISNT
jgi:hypothetical protein